MSEWVRLNLEETILPRKETVQGAEVELLPSPYDIPRAVGSYAEAGKKYVLEFRYLVQDEPVVVGADNDYIKLRVGKNSRRLYRIEIDLAAWGHRDDVQAVLEKIEMGIDHLASLQGRRGRGENYRLTREVIGKEGEKLLRQMVAS